VESSFRWHGEIRWNYHLFRKAYLTEGYFASMISVAEGLISRSLSAEVLLSFEAVLLKECYNANNFSIFANFFLINEKHEKAPCI